MTTNQIVPIETLDLDAFSLRPVDLSMPALMRELNLQKKPSWLVHRLFRASTVHSAAEFLHLSQH